MWGWSWKAFQVSLEASSAACPGQQQEARLCLQFDLLRLLYFALKFLWLCTRLHIITKSNFKYSKIATKVTCGSYVETDRVLKPTRACGVCCIISHT